MKRRFAQTGATLVEAIAALSILSGVIVLAGNMTDQYLNDTEAMTAAQQTRVMGEAAKSYIQANQAAVLGYATATTPCVLSAANMSTYLSGFSGTNVYGQTLSVRVLEPVAGTLQALVVAEGGTAVDDVTLSKISNTVGASGGGIYTASATTVTGAGAGWTLNLGAAPNNAYKAAAVSCVNGAGVAAATGFTTGHPAMAVWITDNGLASSFLYRDSVTGRPELNTMNTPIIMASIQTTGGACTTAGAIARDATGGVLSCKSGTWQGGGGGLTWKGSVANVAALPASGASGDAYRITNLGNHVFVWDAQNSLWQGLVVDASGNMTLPGMVYASGAASNYGALTIQGSKNGYSGLNFRDSSGNNAGTLMVSSAYSGFFNTADNAWRWYVDNAGNSAQAGNAEAGTLQVNTAVAEGSACSPDGKIAKSSTTSGLLLSCQSGVWKKAGESEPPFELSSGLLNGFCVGSTDPTYQSKSVAVKYVGGVFYASVAGGAWVTTTTGSCSGGNCYKLIGTGGFNISVFYSGPKAGVFAATPSGGAGSPCSGAIYGF